MKKKYFLYAIMLFLFFACKKKNAPSPIPYIAIDSGLKKDFGYQPGTYWVYKDSITGRMDSFITISDTSGFLEIPYGNRQYNEYYTVQIHMSEYEINPVKDSFIGGWDWLLFNRTALLSRAC